MRTREVDGGRALGLALYGATLSAEAAVAGFCRFALGYATFTVTDVCIALPLDAYVLAGAIAIAPLAYSVLGVTYPLNGRLWRWRKGARDPVAEERDRIEDALAELSAFSDKDRVSLECYVLDEDWPLALTRGRAVILSRGLIASDGLAAKLAHELGHLSSLDARLTEGLHRMQLWRDPLREGTSAAQTVGVDAVIEGPGAVLFGLLRWLVRLAGGGDVRDLCRRPWAAYWRQREFAADAYAAQMGQADQLLSYLEERELVLDGPQEGFSRGEFDHPYVAERIDHLKGLTEAPPTPSEK